MQPVVQPAVHREPLVRPDWLLESKVLAARVGPLARAPQAVSVALKALQAEAVRFAWRE